MSDTQRDTQRDIHASAPHCGVCVHVTFQDDWDRTPYCTHLDESVEIVVGDACDSFEPR